MDVLILDKKGYFSGYIFLVIIMLILICVMGVQYGTSKEKYTELLTWDNKDFHNNTLKYNSDNSISPIVNIVYRAVDFIGYTTFEIARVGMEWGIKHQIPARKTLIAITWIIILFAAYPIIKIVILFTILFKEYLIRRKEKRLRKDV